MSTTIQHKPFTNKNISCAGFTLIEVMVALVILTIGILSVNAMQVISVRGNSSANTLTAASNWGMDQIEQIFALDYDDEDFLTDKNGDAAAGLDNNTVATADTSIVPPEDDNYTILLNVAEEYPMPNIKTIHIIINRNDLGTTKSVTLRYKKARYM